MEITRTEHAQRDLNFICSQLAGAKLTDEELRCVANAVQRLELFLINALRQRDEPDG